MIQVTATDADDSTYGNSAKVVYSILEGQPYFSVDAETGGGTNRAEHAGSCSLRINHLDYKTKMCLAEKGVILTPRSLHHNNHSGNTTITTQSVRRLLQPTLSDRDTDQRQEGTGRPEGIPLSYRPDGL